MRFKIKPVSGLGPWRKWVVYPPNVVGCGGGWEAYAPILPEAFAIVSRWLRGSRMSDQYGPHSSGGIGNLISDGMTTRTYDSINADVNAAYGMPCDPLLYTQAQVDALVAAERNRCNEVVQERLAFWEGDGRNEFGRYDHEVAELDGIAKRIMAGK